LRINIKKAVAIMTNSASQRTSALAGLLRAGALGVSMAAVPALADDAAYDADGAEVITVIAPEYQAPVITSATRTEVPLRDVPQSITVITRDLIDDQAMRSIADVLRFVPGAQVAQGEGHRDQIVLRGNNSTADFFIDGLRDDVQYYRDLYNVDRIEVLKGPNAMIFGRGGGGGVVNRVLKKAGPDMPREATLQVGSWDQYRGTVDLGATAGDAAALRFNGLYERSDSYRDFVELERFGINPTVRFDIGDATTIDVAYEHFEDDRTVDRGVPSQSGRPFATRRGQFFGNPDLSFSVANVDLVTAQVEHEFGPNLELRSRLLFGDYDKFYQNVFASGAVTNGNVALGAYDSGTNRENLLAQTDLIWTVDTGGIGHTLLLGAEFGRQETANRRNDGVFPSGGNVVPVANPVTSGAVDFARASQNNRGDVGIAAIYLQDQIELSDRLQLIAGLRYDRFEMDFENRLNGARFESADDLVSPRAGLVFKPAEPLSLYASYSLSYLPQSGDQFTTLDLTTAALDPEEFENVEIGVKWDPRPGLAVTAALYRLDRDNTRAPGATAGTTVLTGSQRSKGFELGVNGSVTPNWDVTAGLALQDAEIRSTTSAAPAGRKVPLVPERTLSLWSSYRPLPWLGFGAGVTSQSSSFASISNAVTLPAFTRVDAALFFALSANLKAQINVENLLGERYFATAHNDNNIMPGSPRAVRASLSVRF
jgi:catecholate siderophore receptor